jgi:hypothetical protein
MMENKRKNEERHMGACLTAPALLTALGGAEPVFASLRPVPLSGRTGSANTSGVISFPPLPPVRPWRKKFLVYPHPILE